ncbi:MAG: hypothetical protein QXI58_04220 [Candidatus Micrarchaeia archaeon]
MSWQSAQNSDTFEHAPPSPKGSNLSKAVPGIELVPEWSVWHVRHFNVVFLAFVELGMFKREALI